MPAGVRPAGPAPERDPAGGKSQVVGVKIHGFQACVVRLSDAPDPLDLGEPRDRGPAIDVVLLLGFKALGSHGRTASFPSFGRKRTAVSLARVYSPRPRSR